MKYYADTDENNLFAFRKYRYLKAHSGRVAGKDGLMCDEE